MGEASQETFSGALDYLMSTSSAHGLPNVQRSKSMLSKTIWSLLFLGSVTALTYQVTELSITYLKFNYTVSLDVKFDRSLHFPAVTICNYNPVLRSKLAEASDEFRTKFDVNFAPQTPPNQDSGSAGQAGATNQQSGQPGGSDDGPTTAVSETQSSGGAGITTRPQENTVAPQPPNQDSTSVSGQNTTPGGVIATSGQQTVSQAGTAGLATTTNAISPLGTIGSTATTASVTTEGYESWEEKETGDFYRERDTSYVLEQKLIMGLANISEEERQKMGHSLSTMLLDCKWKGYPCSPSNFTSFFHYKYGNCYTFNHFSKPDLFTNRPGPLYGLSMRLFVEQNEYMPELTETAGFRLVVHDRRTMPFPEDDGIAVSPGFQTAVAARIISIDRLGGLYSNCTTNPDTNNVFKRVFNVSYSLKACERSCYQTQVIKECRCFDPYYPNLPNSTVFPCALVGDEKAKECLETQEEKYKNGTLGCICHQPCKETTYLTSVSSSVWPADKYEEKLYRDIKDQNEEARTNLKMASPGDWVKRNVAKVEVFFQEFNYQYIKQSPAYVFVNLVSDIGGQLGLWLGLSVLTVFEFVETCGLLFRICFAKVGRRRKTTCTPVKTLKIFPVDNHGGVSLENL